MTFDEIKKRLTELRNEKRTKIVIQRTCREGDFAGAVKIILENKNICAFLVYPKGLLSSLEQFITTDDKEFNKEARKILLKYFCSG